MQEPFAFARSTARRLRMGLAVAVAGLLLAAPMASAEDEEEPFIPFTPLQLSLVPGAQVFPQNVPVWGFRINAFYGAQQKLNGIDLGPMNEVDKAMVGLAAGVVNVVHENAWAVEAGVGNSVGANLTGLQVGVVNQVGEKLAGAQIGVANAAEGGAGIQVGILNRSTSMKGLQLGLLNFNKEGLLPFLPILNFGF